LESPKTCVERVGNASPELVVRVFPVQEASYPLGEILEVFGEQLIDFL
jgi:hypothetical protein